MGTVPALLTSRWSSGDLVGDAAHSCMVRIRAGFVNHFYEEAQMLDTTPGPAVEAFPIIWQGHNDVPWQGQWTPTGDWITLTNVQSANWMRSFADKGGSTMTGLIDNIAFTEQTGIAGMYHAIERGWFSPTRGVVVSSRPTLWAENEFADVLNGGYQVELWEGYGVGSDVEPVLADGHWTAPSATKTWVGLIEECDLDSHPDHLTLTCRAFSVLFTDQRLMGQNKATEIHSPVTFADRRKTLGQTKEFGSITVSSGSFTADDQLGAVWLSDTHTDPAHTEWVELHLPAGHYEDFYAAFPFNGEDMYVSLFAAGGASEMDGTTPVADGWVDLGLGTVPDDGEPYIFFHANTFASPSRRWSLGGHTWDLGDGSILRLSFTNLAQDPDLASPADRAGTNAFYAFRFGTDPLHPPDGGAGIHAQGWVLVDDAADVIRELCLWAGFKEMDIEDFGWTLQAPMSFGQDAFFQDVVDAIQAQGNYVWFIDAPTDHDMSLGVPVFRPQSATAPPPGSMVQILDSQLSEALEVKWDLALDVDTPIPTPAGWTTMGALKRGDLVFGADGTQTSVLRAGRVYDDHACYELTFTDGTTITADAGHLWQVRSSLTAGERAHGGVLKTLTTKELAQSVRSSRAKEYAYHIKIAAPLDCPDRDLSIDPYMLGYWLGDGDRGSPIINVADEDVASLLAQIEAAGYAHNARLKANTGCGLKPYWRVSPQSPGRSLTELLRAAGVLRQKTIPDEYLRASYTQRLALLQGLMDSDGCFSGRSCTFASCDADLATTALELIRSLGLRPYIYHRGPGSGGRKDFYTVGFGPRKHLTPFRLARKADAYEEYASRTRANHERAITSIERVPSAPVRCIAVDAPDGLYLAGPGMCPTHNSNLPYVMRFRGAQSNTGSTLFEDTVKRYMGTYWPPWSGHDYTNLQGRNFQGTFPAGRVAGVRRQFSQTDEGLQSNAECLFACILAAIQYALQMVTATCQAAGYPGVSLDQQISVVDEGTGTNTRVWTASIESDHTLGPNGSWHMTLGGSVLDTEDMNMLALDYFYTFQRYVLYKAGT